MDRAENGRGVGRIVLIVAVVIAAISVGYAMMKGKSAPSGESDNAMMAGMSGQPAASPEETIRQLQDRVGGNPKDSEGWQQLGFAYFSMNRYADAARAYRRATQIAPKTAVFWSSMGEALVMADERDPMPGEAAKAFETAISLDPKDPRARYFLAVKKDLAKDHQGAINDWLALLKDTPPGAPWESDLRRTILQAGKISNIDVSKQLAAIKPSAPHPGLGAPVDSVAAAAIPGPSREQMQQASSLPPGQQQMMVNGMVDSLEGKLKANPANVDGWIMLMRSRMTLNEPAKAAAALKSATAANPSQAARLQSEAKILGVPGA